MAKRILGVLATLPTHDVDKGYVDGLAKDVLPVSHAQKEWTFDPALVQGGSLGVAGTLQLARLFNRSAVTVASVTVSVFTAGSALTNVGVGLWSAAGALLTSSVNVNGATAALWAPVGNKVVTFTAPQVIAAGASFYVGWWTTGTTQPSIARSLGLGQTVLNAGLGAAALRFATANTALTNVAPATLGVMAAGAAYWVGAA